MALLLTVGSAVLLADLARLGARATGGVLLFVYITSTRASDRHKCLRSSNLLLWTMPQAPLITKGDRAFSIVAPRLWKKLPILIRSFPTTEPFKSCLKIYFYFWHSSQSRDIHPYLSWLLYISIYCCMLHQRRMFYYRCIFILLFF